MTASECHCWGGFAKIAVTDPKGVLERCENEKNGLIETKLFSSDI